MKFREKRCCQPAYSPPHTRVTTHAFLLSPALYPFPKHATMQCKLSGDPVAQGDIRPQHAEPITAPLSF